MIKRLGWLLGGALMLSVAGLSTAPLAAMAQDDDELNEIAEERAATFQAAEDGAQTENVPGGMLMVAAYGVIWILMMGYLASLGIRQARTAADLERLRQDLASRETDEAKG